MDELEKVKEIFLTDVDEETREENMEKIREWERTLIESEEYQSWIEHPITKQILQKAREQYAQSVMVLGTRKDLSESEKIAFWGIQEAALWLINLGSRDAHGEVERVKEEIRRSLEVTR
jgi:hypothetical protein